MRTRTWILALQGCLAAAGLLLLLTASPAADETSKDRLEDALVRQAPGLIRHFKVQKYRNVGVLKFLVNRDGKRFSDNVGTLNMLLARRLEVALALANDPKEPVGLIRNASAVAARTKDANHLTRAGRQALFTAEYPLAWGKDEVRADAFVTGLASVSKDLKEMTVGLLVFDREDTRLRELGNDFVVKNEALRLGEMGESFVLRRVKDDTGDDPPAREKRALEGAAVVRSEEARHPLQADGPPVALEIRYDGKPVPLVFRGGQARVAEPEAGQKVSLVLRRDAGKEKYGVVLKVNGENTLFHQRRPDLNCNRWVLYPGAEPLEITGFQLDDTEGEAFRVLPLQESREREVHYGEHAGTISMTVFRELKEGEEGRLLISTRSQRHAAAVAAGRMPAKRPENALALKAQLLAEANRGLVVGGDRAPSEVTRVKFRPDPTPVMAVTVVYYRR